MHNSIVMHNFQKHIIM